MKTHFFFLVLLFQLFSCTSDKHFISLGDENLLGDVKSITERNYRAVTNFGEIVKGDPPFEKLFGSYKIFEFDNLGHLITETTLLKSNNPLFIDKYQYDDKFRLLKIGNTMFLDSGIYSYTNLDYNVEGNLIKESNYSSNDSLFKNILYSYFSDNKIEIIEKKSYNKNNNYCVEKYYKENGILETYIYHLLGELFTQTAYEYNESGNISRKEITSIKQGNTSFEVITNTYKYDSIGNWINRIEYKNDSAMYITERKYEYYKK